jgi:hypothetical protein
MALGNGHPLLGRLLCLVNLLYIVAGLLKGSTSRYSSRIGKIMGVLSGTSIRRDREFGITRGSNPRGNGGFVVDSPCLVTRGLKGARFYSSKASMPTGLAALEQLRKVNADTPNMVNLDVSKIVKDVDVLIMAYGNIKSNPGNMSKGSTPETLDGIDLRWFENLSKYFSSWSFKFSPAHSVDISKPKGGTRPLGVGNPRQKIVQEAMR